jgi:predicted MFS family arabinose efflux permease
MTRPGIGDSAIATTTLLSFCLVANLVALMTFPAVLPEVSADWGLSASEAGWIGGIYFAGYAVAVLFLVGAADHVDGRWIVAGSSLLGAAASFAFAGLADGFWPALVIRFLGGIALAGVHMPGLVLLTQRIVGPKQARGVSIYTASYALGSAGSFLVAGIVDAAFGWRATFLAAGIGPLLAIAAVACLPPAPARQRPAGPLLEFRGVFANRRFMTYVLAFAGNTWEVFGIRVWFVACLAWTAGRPGNQLDLPNIAVISGLAALAGVPASVVVAELAAKWNRTRVIVATCAVSVAVCLALAATAGGTVAVVLALLVLLQITSFADVSALGVGAVMVADPARRGAALAIYALAGFTTGFLGPAAVGLSLDWFGGIDSRAGWTAAFLTMSIGSLAAALAIGLSRRRDRSMRG